MGRPPTARASSLVRLLRRASHRAAAAATTPCELVLMDAQRIAVVEGRVPVDGHDVGDEISVDGERWIVDSVEHHLRRLICERPAR